MVLCVVLMTGKQNKKRTFVETENARFMMAGIMDANNEAMLKDVQLENLTSITHSYEISTSFVVQNKPKPTYINQLTKRKI